MPIGWGLDVQMTWTQPEAAGAAPKKRSGHSLTFVKSDPSFAILFGGCDNSLPAGPTNDCFKLALDGDAYAWSTVNVPTDGPCARWHHSATLVAPRSIFMFGGFTNDKRLNDGWIFDAIDETFKRAFGTDDDQVPYPRGAHSASCVGTDVLVFGGYGGKGYGRRDFNDCHSLDTETFTWSPVVTTGETPSARSGHQACVVEDKVYIFGGWNCAEQLNDVSILLTQGMIWTAVRVHKPLHFFRSAT